MLYNRMGENARAAGLFKDILETDPGFCYIAYSLGLLLAEKKQYEEAVIYLKRAAGGLPGRARIHYHLCLLLQHLKKNSETEASLLKALSLEPENPDFLIAIADQLIRQGRLDEALLAAQTIIRKHPEEKAGYDIKNYITYLKSVKSHPKDE